MNVARKISLQYATWMSLILHPASMMLLTAMLYSYRVHADFIPVLLDGIILLAGLLPGLCYIAIQVTKGQFSHYHLVVKEDRRPVLLLLISGLAGALIIYWLRGAPQKLIDGMLIGILGGVGIALVTWFWKISFHAAVGMGCATLFLTDSFFIAAVLAVLAVISGLVRLPIRHHSWPQVLGGWLYGFGVTFVLIWTFGYL